jgi:hypothetical protein
MIILHTKYADEHVMDGAKFVRITVTVLVAAVLC